MTAPTDYYLDCTVDSNGGSGTNGDPWTFTDASGDKIYQAIGNITRDTTNGDRLNVQGQDDTTKAIAPAAAGYGSFASNSIPLIIEGWGGGSQGDGGIFTVDGGGGSFHGFDLWTGNDYPFILVRGKIGNFSTGTPYTCLT
ncbi:MAG: hypothetical protein ACPGVG_15755, partial [Mycobacterium sp.]